MYAIVDIAGQQFKVAKDDKIFVNRLKNEEGESINFDSVLLVGADKKISVGTPTVEGAKVSAKVLAHVKGDKVIIFKYKSKKDYRKKQGHRQPYTLVKIVSLDGTAPAKKAETVEEVEVAVEAVKVSAAMKKDELIAFAKENNIEVDAKATKAVILEAIEAAIK